VHAAPRFLGQSTALLVAGLLVAAGCTAGGSDNPALPEPSTAAGTAPTGDQGGPAVRTVDAGGTGVPVLAGEPAADAALRAAARGLPAGCDPTTELDTVRVASFVWRCPGGRVATATVALPAGPLLSLGDLLSGPWRSYLASVGAAQLRADGVAHPATGDLSEWFLAPGLLEVVFPSGVVAYPLATLGPFVARSSRYGTLLQGA
jgi:hypothetical protein